MRSGLVYLMLLCTPLNLFPQHALQLETRPFSKEEKNGAGTSFSFSIGPETGMLFGMLQEWVFIDREGDYAYDDVLSRLDWQQNPQFYIGAAGSVMPLPRFFIGFGGWIGIPSPLGYLEDRDWNYTTGIYESFSHHENMLNNSIYFDANVGYSIVFNSDIILNCLIGFNFKQISVSGQNGWGEWPPGSPPIPVSGTVIDYEINFFIPYIGLEFRYSPITIFTINAFLAASPWVTFIYARDFHRTSPWGPEYFQDFPQFGFYLSGVISLSFHLGGGWDIRLKNTFMWAPPFKGPSYVNGYRSTVELAGASLIFGGLSLSVNYGFSR